MAQPKKSRSTAASPNKSERTPYLSVVIPLLDEEESLGELYEQIVSAATPLGKPFEMIFIDDGSTDGSLEELRQIKSTIRSPFTIIRFRKNLGKSAALSIGFSRATGNTIVTLD